MPEETKTEEIKTEEKSNLEVDPYVKRLLESTGKSIEQILAPTVDEKKQEAPDEEKLKADADALAAKEKADAEAKALAEKEQADKEAEEARKKESAQPVRPVVLQKKETPEEKKRAEEDDAAKKARESDEAYIASLTPEQQDEIELARFAESTGKKGAVSKLLDYCRKLDKFIDENPEMTADSEAFIKFKEDHEPKMTAVERRKLEREMIATQAVAKATEETRKEFEPVVRELNEIKTAPVIKSVINEVEAAMVKPGAEASIVAETFQKVRAMPYDQAVEEFPVEAPIIVGTIVAAQEWTKIWNSVVPIDEKNPTHRWLMDFVAAKEVEMLQRPAAETTRDGRQFMPLGKFVNLQRTNPALAKNYYSFDQGSVVDLISKHGVDQYNQQLKKLERSGFKRVVAEKKSETTEVEKKKTETGTATGSPKATGHTMVGAGDEAAKAANQTLPAHLRGVMSSMGAT